MSAAGSGLQRALGEGRWINLYKPFTVASLCCYTQLGDAGCSEQACPPFLLFLGHCKVRCEDLVLVLSSLALFLFQLCLNKDTCFPSPGHWLALSSSIPKGNSVLDITLHVVKALRVKDS